jgi:hypothetical protein
MERTSLAHAVHGLVLFLAVVGATYLSGYPTWRVLVLASGTVVLFWAAHVYAHSMAHQNAGDGTWRDELATVRAEARHSLPMLEACIVPTIPLAMAALGIIPIQHAYTASVAIGTLTLGVVGYLSTRNRKASVRRSLAAAVVTGGIGALIIAAETFWH